MDYFFHFPLSSTSEADSIHNDPFIILLLAKDIWTFIRMDQAAYSLVHLPQVFCASAGILKLDLALVRRILPS